MIITSSPAGQKFPINQVINLQNALDSKVNVDGDQTIGGIKTFSNKVISQSFVGNATYNSFQLPGNGATPGSKDQAFISSSAIDSIPLAIQIFNDGGQTSNLTEWRDISGSPKSWIDKDFTFHTPFIDFGTQKGTAESPIQTTLWTAQPVNGGAPWEVSYGTAFFSGIPDDVIYIGRNASNGMPSLPRIVLGIETSYFEASTGKTCTEFYFEHVFGYQRRPFGVTIDQETGATKLALELGPAQTGWGKGAVRGGGSNGGDFDIQFWTTGVDAATSATQINSPLTVQRLVTLQDKLSVKGNYTSLGSGPILSGSGLEVSTDASSQINAIGTGATGNPLVSAYNATVSARIKLQILAASGAGFVGTETNTPLQIGTNNVSRIVISSSGTVSINTRITSGANSTLSGSGAPEIANVSGFGWSFQSLSYGFYSADSTKPYLMIDGPNDKVVYGTSLVHQWPSSTYAEMAIQGTSPSWPGNNVDFSKLSLGAWVTSAGGYRDLVAFTTRLAASSTNFSARLIGWIRDSNSVLCQRFEVDSAGAWTYRAPTTTTDGRAQATIIPSWTTNTEGSQKGRITINARDAAGINREGIRIESDGTKTLLSFFAGSAVAKPTVTGSRADGTALQSFLTAVASLSLITDSTTA